jgi:iron only hydrogenase large subunit-like protein
MDSFTPEASELLELINKEKKMAAMLAPSFPVMFKYPEIVGMLRRLGFEKVVEVSRGAEETNKQLLALTKLHPNRRYITGPCPTIVRLIRNKYPHLVQYLAPIDSPMIATAKLVAKKYKGLKKVFIGPCLIKKLEAGEDYPKLEILAITYRDLQQIFEQKGIEPRFVDKLSRFDIIARDTRLYPISGGLAQSSGVINKYLDPEYDVISGPSLVTKTLDDFLNKPELKILDILNCEGGCINGPGIVSHDSLPRRREKIINYWSKR